MRAARAAICTKRTISAAGAVPNGAVSLLHLQRRKDFLRVAAARRKVAAPGLVLQVAERQEKNDTADKRVAPAPRVGYTVSRKVGGAVVRNRARRRLKAAAQRVMTWHARPEFDYVLIGRVATIKRDFVALMHDLEQTMKRLNAWR